MTRSPAAVDGDLADMQAWMLDALIAPDQVQQEDVAARFTCSARLAPEERLAIYQRGYILRLAKCLAEQFPGLCCALGEPLFHRFAREYLRSCPSESYTLHELGRRFPEFLDEDRPDRDAPAQEREGWIDFMVDLARYERLHFRLFDAPGHEGAPWPDPEVPDDRLLLQPCFGLGAYRYPVAWYYHVTREDPEAAFPAKEDSYVAVLRRDFVTIAFPVNKVHYEFLRHLQRDRDIGRALAHVADVVGSPPEEVARSWRQEVRTSWIGAGFFVEKPSPGPG